MSGIALYYSLKMKTVSLLEEWGTGTTRIIELCKAQELPEPEFAEQAGSFKVVFLKDPYAPERLRAMGLNERQIKAVLYVKEHGKITNREYRKLTTISDEGARLDLKQLVEKGILKTRGAGRSTRYVLRSIGD